MKIVQVTDFSLPPKCVEIEAPPVPSPDSDMVQIKVIAAGVHQVVRSRAAGKHYSAKGLPHTLGVDGVGTTADGKMVYFLTFTPLGGSFAEIVNVPKNVVVPVPDGLDPVQVAGLLNPAMSSWMAMTQRTTNLPKGFSVLIVGVTSASGTVAIDLARALGAGKFIGVARNVKKMLDLGLDETIELKEPVTETDFSKANDVDVILDYLYGEPALQMFKTLAPTKSVQYVQIGSLSSTEMNFPGDILRSKDITMRGAGPGSWSMKDMGKQLPAMVQAFAHVKPQKLKTVALKDTEAAWSNESGRFVVVT